MGFVFQDLNILKARGLTKSTPFSWNKHARVFPARRVLIWFTYWCDYKVWGMNASGWRATSLLIHMVNAFLLILISPWAALLFFVHPLTLMGSSYIAGRSGMMSGTFQIVIAILCLWAWWKTALGLALLASLKLKEDSVIFFPMIAVLWSSR